MVNFIPASNIDLANRIQPNYSHVLYTCRQGADKHMLVKLANAENNNFALIPAVKKELPINKRISLVYGFDNIRNLDSGDGVIKCTLDQLNQALNITHAQLDYRIIRQIRMGVAISRRGVRRFTALTGIDYGTAKKLLKSWRDFLRDHYDFISLKSRLLTKIEKCQGTCRNRECAKTILIKNSPGRLNIDDKLHGDATALFRKFILRNDVAGFKALSACGNKNRAVLTGIIKTMLLRRIIKLGLEWSKHLMIMVNFDVNFRHQTAMKADDYYHNQYWPLTYSAYRYCRRQSLDHVMIRNVPNAEACTAPILRVTR